ncbi:MAG: hypothetical protein Q8R55_05435 [Candidatus Taylorbacteria bacterium]|nr:hypothetical protein [Candidatus Taylorbacteria bacterium]
MIRNLAIFVFLLMPVMVCGQDNTVEIKKIEKQIKSFEENLATFEKFSENFLAEAKSKGSPMDNDLLLKLLAFDTNLLDLRFKILITRGVFESLNSSVSKDSLVELQLNVLRTGNKLPLEFVKDMLPLIEKGMSSLKKEKDLISKW